MPKGFDFTKKPHRPSFLMDLAKLLLSWPDLKRRGAQLVKMDMEELEGKPYLLLVTHSSMVDFNLMLRATHPYAVNNVMTLEGFHTYTEPLMRSLGVLGTRKFVTDINLVRNIRYCLEELKSIFVLFPEARYSLDGCTSYLPDSLGRLARLLKVPVAVLAIHGNFVTCPQWNKIDKKSRVEARLFPIVKPGELGTLSAQKINRRILEAFQYDDFRWQYENRVVIDHPNRAQGLHALLYRCPCCGREGRMFSQGTSLRCDACGKEWEMDEYGRMAATNGETEFAHIPDWARWERACVREEIRSGTYRFEDTVRVETLPGSLRFYQQGQGTLIQTPEGTRLRCVCYGKPVEVFWDPYRLESMHIEYDYLGGGDCVDLSLPDESYWCYLSQRDAITKLSFATEEIFFLAREQSKKTGTEPSVQRLRQLQK